MNQRYDDPYDPWPAIAGFVILLLELSVYAVLGGFFLSSWLMRKLFQWVLLPLCPPLRAEDGLVVLVCAAIWSPIWGFGLLPFLNLIPILEIPESALTKLYPWCFIFGGLWGVVIAVDILSHWWQDILARQPPQPKFTDVLGLDEGFYESPTTATVAQPTMTIEDLEAQYRTAPDGQVVTR